MQSASRFQTAADFFLYLSVLYASVVPLLAPAVKPRPARWHPLILFSYYSQIELGPSITGRQVTLRSLTPFPFIASRQGNDGGFHPPIPQPGDRSRTRPVGAEAWRSVGNRKERHLWRDYASSPVQSKAPSSLRAYRSFLSENSINRQAQKSIEPGPPHPRTVPCPNECGRIRFTMDDFHAVIRRIGKECHRLEEGI